MIDLKKIEGIVQDYTLVLSTRDYRHLGQISKFKGVNSNFHMNSANEISFTVYKAELMDVYKGSIVPYATYKKIVDDLWNKIVDFRLVWVKELNEYYEIKVSIDDAAETIKTITGRSLCEEELSQVNIYSMEINTESDISRKDYYVDFPTVFYRDPSNIEAYNSTWNKDKELYSAFKLDENGNILVDKDGNKVVDEEATVKKRVDILKNSSLMHRALDKVPHYSIDPKDVDESLKKEQRTFSVSGSTVYDFLIGECAEQFNCLFLFDSATRKVSVKDLYTVCNDCGYRGDDFYDESTGVEKCPKCGCTSVINNYGEDTTIFIDKNNLTDSIRLETNADNIKNCFKLASGDDLMDTAIASLNPNGSNYLHYLSKYQRLDMPKELVTRIEDYNALFKSKEADYEKLTLELWTAQAEIDKLTHTLMPTVATAEVTATTEVAKINEANKVDATTGVNQLYVGISKLNAGNNDGKTIDNAVKNYMKLFVKSGYVKVEIVDEEGNKPVVTKDYNEDGTTLKEDENKFHSGTWTGAIRITNYSDKEDVKTTERLTVRITDNYKEYMDQKILKGFAEDDEEGSLFDVLAVKDLDKFKEYLTQYCQVRLKSFYDAIEGAIIVLDEGNTGDIGQAVYDAIAPDYQKKLGLVQEALDAINGKIAEQQAIVDEKSKARKAIQDELNFENYLGDLYSVYCSYRREDTYENANYISDGLTDSQLLDKAKEYLKVANQELAKAGEPQYTISSTLYNLLLMDEFKPILGSFKLGNWLRVKIDGTLYKMRLIGYSVSFDNLQTISVEFSNVSKVSNIITDTKQILQSAKSMSTSAKYVAKQAEKGNDANTVINETVSNGLSSADIQIKNNDKEEVTLTKQGLLCKAWNDELDGYDPKQLRITHNVMAFTNDNWKNVKQAIGEHKCTYINPITYTQDDYEGYGVTTDFVNSGIVVGSTMVGGMIFSDNYALPAGTNDTNLETNKYDCTGSFIDLRNGHFSYNGKLKWDGKNLHVDTDSVINAVNVANPENLKIRPESIDVTTSKIKSGQIESIIPEQINTNDNKIQAGQIESVNLNQVSGIEDVEVKAENITGTLSSAQISDALTNKTISGSFSGTIAASSITASDATKPITTTDANGLKYNTITGEFTIGGITMKFVNGLLVDSTPVV